MRVAIESAALPVAVPLHDDRTLHRLRATLASMQSPDADFPALNVEFHAQVIAPTPYRELFRTAHALLARAQRYAFVHTVPGYRKDAQNEHAAIFELLEDRDLDGLQHVNAHHIMSAADQLVAQIEGDVGTR
jgi:DNA-binding GntR family transcriptional regulator